VGAQWIRERKAAVYNDDGQCFFGTETREERCGAYRAQGETAQTLANWGYVAAGAFGVVSAVLFITSRSKATPPRLSLQVDRLDRGLWVGCGSRL